MVKCLFDCMDVDHCVSKQARTAMHVRAHSFLGCPSHLQALQLALKTQKSTFEAKAAKQQEQLLHCMAECARLEMELLAATGRQSEPAADAHHPEEAE